MSEQTYRALRGLYVVLTTAEHQIVNVQSQLTRAELPVQLDTLRTLIHQTRLTIDPQLSAHESAQASNN